MLQNVHNKTMDIMSVIIKSYTSNSNKKSTSSKHNDLVVWVLLYCRHSLKDIQETILEICKRGDIESMKIVMFDRIYKNLINESCIHNAFESGELKFITMLIVKFPGIKLDKKVAFNNASTNGNISVVQWLFHTYAVRPNRLPFLEPILD